MGLFGFGKNKSRKEETFEVKRQAWNFYSYTYGENMTALIEFDHEFAIETTHNGYNACKRVIIHIAAENCGPNGLAFKEENQRIQQLELGLLATLSTVDCKLAGKMSYGAMCDFCFQTNDAAAFMEKAQHWIANQKSHKIVILESDGWEFFDSKVKPNIGFWQQISDRRVIGTLLEHGSNPELVHTIEHAFIGDNEKLQTLSRQLAADGFTLLSLNEESLTMSKPAKLLDGELSNLTQRLAGYTAGIGIKYDGWGTKIEK